MTKFCPTKGGNMRHVSEYLSGILREMRVAQTKNWKEFIDEAKQRQHKLNEICKNELHNEKILESIWSGPHDEDSAEQ